MQAKHLSASGDALGHARCYVGNRRHYGSGDSLEDLSDGICLRRMGAGE